jgi:3-deoxy-D-manno-octulosonate 8-phosphate phosphatase (KDO 8-P phosphatase)
VDNSRIKLIAVDVDGTLTDGSVFQLPQGQYRRYSTYDGYGFEIARNAGIDVVLMSRSNSEDIVRRAEHLGVDYTIGTDDKESALKSLVIPRNISLESVCFMGNDITDLGAMHVCGYSACPNDAHDYVKTQCAITGFISIHNGGHGAFRELIDWLVIWDFKKIPYPNISF